MATYRVVAVLAFLSLAACASTAPPSPYVHVCPIVPTYSKEFDAKAADEFAALPADSNIAVMIEDYIAIRDEARACK
jgi:hypothetical protein